MSKVVLISTCLHNLGKLINKITILSSLITCLNSLSHLITLIHLITLNGSAPNGTVESNLTFDGSTLNVNGNVMSTTMSTTGDVTIGGQITVGKISASLNEGGQIDFASAPNGSLTASTVSIDIYQDRLRIFENGGAYRGAYIDLTEASSGVGSNLLGSEWVNAGTCSISATTTAPTKGTIVQDKVRYRRVNKTTYEVEYRYSQSTIVSAGIGTYIFDLPT